MRKLLAVLFVIALCVSLSVTAFATRATFVPSVSDKDVPPVVGGDPTILENITISSLKDAVEGNDKLNEEQRQEILDAYDELTNGGYLPAGQDFVIRDLVYIENKDNTSGSITITLDMGVSNKEEIVAYVFVDGKWVAVNSVINNGDGTVTLVLDAYGPVAFAVKGTAPQTGDAISQNAMMWGGIFGASLIALVAVIAVYSRKRKCA